MALSELYTILSGITGFSNKVAYYCFPEGQAPALPFICYLVKSSENFIADNKVYKESLRVDVELYTETKSESTETLIETALNNNHIVWEKTEAFLDDERCFMITYSIQI